MNKAIGIGLLVVIFGVALIVVYYLTSKLAQSTIPAPLASNTQQGRTQESTISISTTIFPAGTTLKLSVPVIDAVPTSNAVVMKTASVPEAPPTVYTKANFAKAIIGNVPASSFVYVEGKNGWGAEVYTSRGNPVVTGYWPWGQPRCVNSSGGAIQVIPIFTPLGLAARAQYPDV
jgi:hypothetical protein